MELSEKNLKQLIQIAVLEVLHLDIAKEAIAGAITANVREVIKETVQLALQLEREDMYNSMARVASESTGRYLETHLYKQPYYLSTQEVRKVAFDAIRVSDGHILEFGVFEGRSLMEFASHAGGRFKLFGFDSFEGLPEDWITNIPKGAIAAAALPDMPPSVELIKGWFSETLPTFVKRADMKPCALIHIDCDLYSSTKTVFQWLAPFIIPGTVIVFDEYLNYPGWELHEYKAFQEFIAWTGKTYEYLCYYKFGGQVVVRITS